MLVTFGANCSVDIFKTFVDTSGVMSAFFIGVIKVVVILADFAFICKLIIGTAIRGFINSFDTSACSIIEIVAIITVFTKETIVFHVIIFVSVISFTVLNIVNMHTVGG